MDMPLKKKSLKSILGSLYKSVDELGKHAEHKRAEAAKAAEVKRLAQQKENADTQEAAQTDAIRSNIEKLLAMAPPASVDDAPIDETQQ